MHVSDETLAAMFAKRLHDASACRLFLGVVEPEVIYAKAVLAIGPPGRQRVVEASANGIDLKEALCGLFLAMDAAIDNQPPERIRP